MEYILIACAAIVAAVMTPRYVPSKLTGGRRRVAIVAFRTLLALVAVFCVVTTSVVSIPANQVGVVRRIYGWSNLANGHFIATQGETGYQAQIIPPGTFRFSPFVNVFNTVERLPAVVIPSGYYGRIVANDGSPLAGGQIMADAWPDEDYLKFLDAEYFLTHGGQKGLQLSVLKPGIYPLNLALYQVKIGYARSGNNPAANSQDTYDIRGLTLETVDRGQANEAAPLDTSITNIPAGFVGVVRSSVEKKGIDCTPITAKAEEGGLTAELVPQGCRGIWSTSLLPNDYYLNRDAYDVTMVPTRVTALEFQGGFERRYIDLKVDAKGDFIQTERLVAFPQPNDAADVAISTTFGANTLKRFEVRTDVVSEESAPAVSLVRAEAERAG